MPEPTVPRRTKASAYQRPHYEPKTFDPRSELYRIFGVDLTNVPASSRLQPKPSHARSAQMCLGFAMLPPLHSGWDFVLRTRSVVAKCSIPRTRCHCPTRGCELAASRQTLSRRVLSAYHSEAQFRLRRQAAQLGFQVIPYRTGEGPWESASEKLMN